MKIGVILAHFQAVGKRPDAIDRLNNFVRLGAMEAAVECSMAADILSGPVDFAVLSRDLVFSAEETRWANIGSSGSGSLTGLKERLKQLWKKSLSNCAFPASVVTKDDPSFNAGIEVLRLLTSFTAFQNSFELEDPSFWKKVDLLAHSRETTLFLSALYLLKVAPLPDLRAAQNKEFCLLIAWNISFVSQGKFLRGFKTEWGMHLSIMFRNMECQLVQQASTSLQEKIEFQSISVIILLAMSKFA